MSVKSPSVSKLGSTLNWAWLSLWPTAKSPYICSIMSGAMSDPFSIRLRSLSGGSTRKGTTDSLFHSEFESRCQSFENFSERLKVVLQFDSCATQLNSVPRTAGTCGAHWDVNWRPKSVAGPTSIFLERVFPFSLAMASVISTALAELFWERSHLGDSGMNLKGGDFTCYHQVGGMC